jgi:four helix bundle protein
MHDYRKLRVWQEAIELAVEVYSLTHTFPTDERFNLTSQLNRAGVSVASNIGEGAGRGSNGEFILFLGYANGSCIEVLTQAIIAERLNFGQGALRQQVINRAEAIQRQLFSLIKTLRS